MSMAGGGPGAGPPLFACTRCNARHPFEELSSGQQYCKECRGSYPCVKCTYCRTEFQEESKAGINTICKKCEQNVKLYGKPSACEYCNIIAGFIGNKCQRCTNSEKKYGPPLACEMCKQRCAFDRKDPEARKKVDGKLLCWLCTLSYKRALAKAKQNDASMRHTSISVHKGSGGSRRPSSSSRSQKSEHRSHHRNHHGVVPGTGNNSGTHSSSAAKKPRISELGSKGSNGSINLPTAGNAMGGDPSNSHEHVVAVTQLKEQMSNLQRQLQRKDTELLEKDKKIAELNAQKKREEREWREKLHLAQKGYGEKIESMREKISGLQKQNATLSKSMKKSGSHAMNSSSSNNNNNNNNITPNDSPLLAT